MKNELMRFQQGDAYRWVYVVLVGFLLSGIAAAWPKDSRKMIDIDGDGYKEAEVFYSGKEVVRTLVDEDHDGQIETIIYYKNGARERAEQDFGRDGKTDRWIYYYFTGTPWKIAEDFDRDGMPDYWLYLKEGSIYRWEQETVTVTGNRMSERLMSGTKAAKGSWRSSPMMMIWTDFLNPFRGSRRQNGHHPSLILSPKRCYGKTGEILKC